MVTIQPEDQQRVLDLARSLAYPLDIPRSPLPAGTLRPSSTHLKVSPELGEALARAAEECEHIDPDEIDPGE